MDPIEFRTLYISHRDQRAHDDKVERAPTLGTAWAKAESAIPGMQKGEYLLLKIVDHAAKFKDRAVFLRPSAETDWVNITGLFGIYSIMAAA